MVKTILYIWLVLSFVWFKDNLQSSDLCQDTNKRKTKTGKTKTNINRKYHRISLRKLFKAAFFLKSQGMAKPDLFYHDNGAERVQLDMLETAETATRDTPWLHLMSRIGSLIIQRGLRVIMPTHFLAKKRSL